ncbi:MAG: hypothetical protein IT200_14100 [Thermoleophilia bacterium]|nr:hypothetical protein [Thermoleophilia bacterium]
MTDHEPDIDRVAIAEERRKAQEGYAWQTLGLFLVTQGVLLGFLANVEDDRSLKVGLVAGLGAFSGVIFLQTYLRARWYEEQYSRWLSQFGLDHHSMVKAALDTGGRSLWERGGFRWFVQSLKARHVWPALFTASAVGWIAFIVWILVGPI